MARTTKTPKLALVHQHDDGTIHALSSDGAMVYTVRIGSETSCTCPAGRNARRCYHVATAEQRYAAFWPRPLAIIVPAEGPEPTPPAVAALRPAVCQAALYSDCDCPACLPAFAEAA